MALLDDIGALESMTLAPISVSSNAILVYQAVPDATRQMLWMDRAGKTLAAAKEPGEWGDPRLSPDGNRALVAKLGPDAQNADLWLLDTAGNLTRFSDTPIHEGSPVWSPDGSRVAFFQFGPGAGNFDLYTRSLHDSSRPELLLKSESPKYPTDWSHDGRYLLFATPNPGTKSDVWALTLPDRRAGPVLGTVYNEGYATLSPDGKWLAFQSDESGKNEVYVQRFEGLEWSSKRHYHLSPGGGGHPRWRGDGKELYYITIGGRIMAVPVHPSVGEFEAGAPSMLFQTPSLPKKWNLYDVSPDGQRFLLNLPLELTQPTSIAVVTNWSEKRKRPAESGQ